MSRTGQARIAVVVEDDAAVIERSVGDPDRFADIFDRHAPFVHRYLARRLGREIADDLVAETFLVAFRGRQRYDVARRDARPWLYGIATNLVGQHRRHELREYRLRQAIVPEANEVCHADRVAADVTAQGVHGVLFSALGRLAPGDRDVLLLIAWEDLTYDQVATALEIPIGTVRSRLSRARKQVRDHLGGTNPINAHEEFEENTRHG